MALIERLFHSLKDEFSQRFDDFEYRLKQFLRRMFDSLESQLAERKYAKGPLPSYRNPSRIPVQPGTSKVLHGTVKGNFKAWTCIEQAELVNSIGSSHHVFAILEHGAGKSLAYLGAPLLIPNKLFLAILPLSPTDNLQCRLSEIGIYGGVYGQDQLDPYTDQLVLASVQDAGTDSFHAWAKSLQPRLFRVFIHDAHNLLIDHHFRRCLNFFRWLTAIGVPLTFLSSVLMPRAIPCILEEMKITDISQVDEIRCYTGQPRLKYIIEKFESEEYLSLRVQSLVDQGMEEKERGIVYVSSVQDAESMSNMLDCQMYTGQLYEQDAIDAWYRGTDRWLVTTEVLRQEYHALHVRTIIQCNPSGLLDWFQQNSQSGRKDPSTCYTLWTQPPHTAPEDPDHRGRMEMRMLLQTSDCIRLACAPLHGETHSCNAIHGELCSNCEKIAQVCIYSARLWHSLTTSRFHIIFITL